MRLISTLKRAKYIGAAMVLLLAAMPMSPIATWIAGNNNVHAVEATEVTDYTQLYSALYYGGAVKLGADIVATGGLYTVLSDATLDLNGHNITLADEGYIGAHSAALTIEGSGEIVKTSTNGYPVLYAYNGSTITMNSGTVRAQDYAVDVSYGDHAAGGKFVMNGGSIISGEYGVFAGKNATVTINGGEITASSYALSGNGRDDHSGAKFYVNGGTLTSTDDYAIYIPQIGGVLEVAGGEITGAAGAIAANRGSIAVSGGTLKSLGTASLPGSVTEDGTKGYSNAVIGIAKEYDSVVLSISDGEFIAEGNAGMIIDPSGLDNANTATVTISGGEFTGSDEIPNVVSGKVVYKKDGTYYVSSDKPNYNFPSRIMIEACDDLDTCTPYTFEGLADNTVAQKYGTVEAHYHDSSAPAPVFDKATGTLKSSRELYGAATLTYDIYESVSGVMTPTTKYDQKVLFDTYSVSAIEPQYVEVEGTTEVEIDAAMSKFGDVDFTNVVISTGDEDIATIVKNTDNDKYTITGVGAGSTKVIATVTDVDTSIEEQVVELGEVYVWDFETDVESRYDMAQGDSVNFTMTEANSKGEITCKIGEVECGAEESSFTLTDDGEGNYTLTAKGTATADKYVLTFTDTIVDGDNSKVVATKTVTVRIHEVVVKDASGAEISELYVKRGTPATVTVTERNGRGIILASDIVVKDAAGKTVHNRVTVSPQGNNTYEIRVHNTGAGEYTIEFADRTGSGKKVATKTINVYAMDFTVDKQEYHIVKGDDAVDGTKLVEALNRYWEETSNGSTTGFKVLKESNANYYVQWDGAEADKYTIEFYAYAGPDYKDLQNRVVRDTKTVDIYVYEMVTPDEDEYRGEIAPWESECTFEVDVDDAINSKVDTGTDPKMAQITAEVTYGDAEAVEIDGSTVTISKPGRYQVTYTDTMDRGEGGVVGTWTAEFKVYALDADAPKGEIINMTAGENYSYIIDPVNTYGLVRVTISKKGKHGSKTTVYRDETRYHGSGTAEEEAAVKTFNFDPSEYGEGEYTVNIRNLSAEDFGEVEEGSFYVVAREYDFMMVEQGTPIEITSGSSWKVDEAYENGNELTVVDGKAVNLDTSELSLGAHNVVLGHEFDGGPGGEDKFEAVKIVTVVVYKVTASEDTAELNPGAVTVATIKDLYERTAKATAELIRDLVAAGVPEETIYCSPSSAVGDCDWAWGKLYAFDMLLGDHLTIDDIAEEYDLSEEQAAMINLDSIQEAVNKFKAAFGEEGWNENGLRTAALLNQVSSGIFSDEAKPLETEVKVTDINETIEADEKAEIEQALADAGVEVDNIEYYDVSVLLKVDGSEFGRLHKLNGKITVALAKTSDPASGYTRQYFVIRKHGDGKPIVLTEGVDFYIENGVIYVISDEFSTYAVAYKDTLIPKAPDTGDEVTATESAASVNLSTAIVIALAAVVLGGAAVFAKRK